MVDEYSFCADGSSTTIVWEMMCVILAHTGFKEMTCALSERFLTNLPQSQIHHI